MNNIELLYEHLADEVEGVRLGQKTWDNVFLPGYILDIQEVETLGK